MWIISLLIPCPQSLMKSHAVAGAILPGFRDIPGAIATSWGETTEGVIFALAEKGEISPIVEGDNGFLFFRLLERNPGATRPFSQLRGQILGKLQAARNREAGHIAIEEATRAIPVRTHVAHLALIEGGAEPDSNPQTIPPVPVSR